MNTSQVKKIIEALKDQQSIFGDDLFEEKITPLKTSTKNINTNKPIQLTRKTTVVKESVETYSKKKDNVDSNWINAATLDELDSRIHNCTKCPLHKGRTNFVFGSGNPNADVVVVGEGPGAEEDKQGLPFVGRAGQLLTDILSAIQFTREEVYICNIVKCRPPGNRAPLPDEMNACIPYLEKQIELIKPKLILCLGLTAAIGLLKKKESLTNLRGKVFEYEGIKTMVTFHPAALLRNPNWKRGCWEDVQKFRKLYDEINI